MGGTDDNYAAICALKEAGIFVDCICDATLEEDFQSDYINIKNFRDVLENAGDYYHLVFGGKECSYAVKERVKLLQYAGVEEFGIIFYGFLKDFKGKRKQQEAVYDSIFEVFGDIDFLGHWDEVENCRRAATEGICCWDVLLAQIYRLYRKRSGIAYLEVGPGVGVMSLALKKLMDIDVTWVNIPNEEKLWSECRREPFKALLRNYGIKVIEGFIELDDFSRYNGSYDVIVLSQVMEHLIFNPVNTLRKLRSLLKDDGAIFLSVPEEIKHYNVRRYSEMPYPGDLTEAERERRTIINEFGHFHEYSYEEAAEAFAEPGLKVITHLFAPPIHHFMLKKKL